MNGRIYDPTIARFISPDPFISGGGGLQGHNRYSYCLNNPLKFVDPSGYIQKPLGWNDPLPFWNNGLGGVKGWCGPGSNKHWSDNYRSQYENYFLMSQRDFMDRYSMNSDQYYGFMGQINPNLTSKIGTTDDKYVVTNYSSLHKNGGFYINPNGNYFYLQAIFDDNTKITSIIKLSSNEQVYLSFDFNNPQGGGSDLATWSFIAGAASLGYDSWQNLAYDGYNYIPSKGPNAGKPTSVWKMNKSGNFALKNGSKFPNSANAASKLMATSIVKIGGIALTTVGLGFTVYDIRQNGLNLSNGTDFVMGGVAYVPGWGWAVSGGYFIGKACYEIYPSIPADYWGRPGTGFSR